MTHLPSAPSVDPVLEARDLRRSFPAGEGETPVLRGIDLAVAEGEFLAVMGASGSGKSTLLYALAGLDRPSSGSVLVEGRDLTGLREAELAALRLHRLGLVLQQPHFLEQLTIRDNVLLPALAAGLEGAGARVDVLLERVGIAHVAHHGVTEVSGGQLQRASICRALVASPAVLFADEPTGALNSAMSAEVMDAIGDVHVRGTTVVMVTHDPRVAARADRVVALRDGEVAAEIRLDGAAGLRESSLQEWLSGQGI